jgi:FkbM family methyltransferase
MKVDYLQIGSHIGNSPNDNVFNKITEGMNVILVEPMPELFSKLVKNYHDKSATNNIEFLNLAVSTYDGTLDLYSYSPLSPPPLLPKKHIWSRKIRTHLGMTNVIEWADQLASVNKNHVEAHGIYNNTIKTTVPCKTLNTIIRERNISSIENLHTDTEGHDYDILMSLDLELVKPTNIVFESVHTDGPLKKGENYLTLRNKFQLHGYRVVEEGNFDTYITRS